jgi:hypothetical protein
MDKVREALESLVTQMEKSVANPMRSWSCGEVEATSKIEYWIDQAKEALASPEAAPVTQLGFAGHRLVQPTCNHEQKTDTALCECGWQKDFPTCGMAFDGWLTHVAPSPAAGVEQVRITSREIKKHFAKAKRHVTWQEAEMLAEECNFLVKELLNAALASSGTPGANRHWALTDCTGEIPVCGECPGCELRLICQRALGDTATSAPAPQFGLPEHSNETVIADTLPKPLIQAAVLPPRDEEPRPSWRLVNQLEREIMALSKEWADCWHTLDMYSTAWCREIGGFIRRKTHQIDGYVLRTRDALAEAEAKGRKEALEEARCAYQAHYHVAGEGENVDQCRECRLDLRDRVHLLIGETKMDRIRALAASRREKDGQS